MNGMWEIRERGGYPHYRKGSMKSYRHETDEAYECGYEDGYVDAMKKYKHYEGERSRKDYHREYDER